MKNQVLLFILIVSLTFNLAFIGMFIWHITHPPILPDGPEFHRFRDHMRERPGELESDKKEFMDSRRRFMDYLSGDEFDEQVADSLRQDIIDKQIKLETAFGKKLIEMRKNGEFHDEHFRRPPEEREPKPQRRRK